MPFGLRNAGQTFQRFIDEVLRGLKFCFAYIKDMLFFSKTNEEHLAHLRQLFRRLELYGVVISFQKFQFGVYELSLLGHHVHQFGIHPLPERVTAIKDFPKPRIITKLREFLGAVKFYRRFVPHRATILQPLNDFFVGTPKKDALLLWTPLAIRAFKEVKSKLATAALLTHPQGDFPTGVMVDASNNAVGAVLQQINNQRRPISVFSICLSPTERRYSTFRRELLAAYLTSNILLLPGGSSVYHLDRPQAAYLHPRFQQHYLQRKRVAADVFHLGIHDGHPLYSRSS